MSGIYYAAVEGDPLDSGDGGYIYATKKAVGTIADGGGKRRNFVFIGDEGYCAKCKTAGPITYGAGLSERKRLVDCVNGGRHQAVGCDVVLCNCSDPPRIIAIYGQRWRIRDDGEMQAQLTRASATASQPIYDEQVTLVDRVTDQPLQNFPYRFRSGDGIVMERTTGVDGFTDRIATVGAKELHLEHTVGEGDGWE